MAIVGVGKNSDDGSGTAVSIAHLQTLQAGDWAIVQVNSNNDVVDITDNNGTDTFLRKYQDNPSASSTYAIFSRALDGGEGSTFDFTIDNSESWSAQVRIIRADSGEIDWDIPPAVATQDSALSGTTATAPSITTTVANTLGLVFVSTDGSSTTYSAPTNGYGDLLSHAAGRSQGSVSKAISSAGATGTTALTLSGSNDWAIHQVALKEVGGAARTITANIAEAGDTVSATLRTVVAITANVSEAGDTVAASVVVVSTAEITASISEAGDVAAASMLVSALITANISEDGDRVSAAFTNGEDPVAGINGPINTPINTPINQSINA